MQPSPNPILNGGVPEAAASGVQLEAQAPVETQVQVTPQVPEWQKPFDELRGGMAAMYQMLQGMQPQQQVAPQAPVAPQPTLLERLQAIGDPLTGDPSQFYGGLAEAIAAEKQSWMNEMQAKIDPRLKTLDQIESDRAQNQQMQAFSQAFKTNHPELAQIPDQLIGQRLQQYQQDPSLIMQALARDFSGALNTKNPPQAQPLNGQPQPSAAATIPNGTPQLNIAKMQQDFQAWRDNGMLAQQAKMNDPLHWSQVHKVATENGWQ